MSEQVSAPVTRENRGFYLIGAGLVMALAGTTLVHSAAWPLGYLLMAFATTVWLVGSVAVGVRVALRDGRADG